MTELELNRAPRDRRLFVIDAVGTLRFEGVFSRSAIAEADGASWRFRRTGFWRRCIEAVDADDTPVGRFEPNGLRRGGRLRWQGRELMLRPASRWRERYALVDGQHELAVLERKRGGRRSLRITVPGSIEVEPSLLLFAAFVVRGLGDDADAATAAGATTAAT